MDRVETPEHYLCPISLEIIKDPVTTITGITYDRENIQRWLCNSGPNCIPRCPVTMQPIPPGSDLTPNLTLRRLIHTWRSANPSHVAATHHPLTLPHASATLIHHLRHHPCPQTKLKTLQKLEAMAADSQHNRVLLSHPEFPDALASFVVSCHQNRSTKGLEEALSLLHLVLASSWGPPGTYQDHVVDSLLWVLSEEERRLDSQDTIVVKTRSAHLLRAIMQRSGPSVLEHLQLEFFRALLCSLRPENSVPQEGVISVLHILLKTCAWGRNRMVMVELGAVGELVEVEARGGGERRTTEIVLEILGHLCLSSDGRAQLVGHPEGIPAVTRRMLKVSPAADDSAIFVIWLVTKYSGTANLEKKLARAGTLARLCLVVQADRGVHLKEKAMEVLRWHTRAWNRSTRDLIRKRN